MTIQTTKTGSEATILLQGRLDTMTAPQLEAELRQTIPGLRALTLDFAGLDYLSSAGLRVLLLAQKQMNQQGQMKLIHVNQVIMEILDVTGFTNILTIVPGDPA